MPSEEKVFGSTFEEYELVDQGEYEVRLTAEPKMYGADQTKPGLLCRFEIRGDVDQKFKGASVIDTIWEDKNKDEWGGWYDHRKLHKIFLTQPNPKLNFKSCDEAVQYINGLYMRITIDKKYDDYKGKTVNEVRYLSYEKSKVGAPIDGGAEAKAKPATENKGLDLDDSEIPF